MSYDCFSRAVPVPCGLCSYQQFEANLRIMHALFMFCSELLVLQNTP